MQQHSDEFLEKVRDELKKCPDDLDLERELYEEHSYFDKEFPNIFRYSFLVACYSYLEQELIAECKVERNVKSLSLDVTDLSGKGIIRAKNYLTKVAGVDFPDYESWNEITYIMKIRNFIVHRDGVLDDSKKAEKIRAYIGRRQDISIMENKIILSADYCRHVVNIIEAFLGSLYNPHLRVPESTED